MAFQVQNWYAQFISEHLIRIFHIIYISIFPLKQVLHPSFIIKKSSNVSDQTNWKDQYQCQRFHRLDSFLKTDYCSDKYHIFSPKKLPQRNLAILAKYISLFVTIQERVRQAEAQRRCTNQIFFFAFTLTTHKRKK